MYEPFLDFHNVTFGYTRNKPLFENLTCSIARNVASGTVVALMGPSGVGKTTFCDLAIGTKRPLAGSVTFAAKNAHIATIPQKGVVFGEMTIEQNISCLRFSKTLGATFSESRVQTALDDLNLRAVSSNGVNAENLSGGEAQRVMLARIHTIDCDLLVLDEPCSFLDNRVKNSFLAALKSTVAKQKLLALMVTHVWQEARLIADEVYFFNQSEGRPVTLHMRTPRDAEECPPTADAMFSIYWPDCMLLETGEIPSAMDFVFPATPFDATHVGIIFGSERAKDRSDIGCLSTSKERILENPQCADAMKVVFFDKHGVAISNRVSDSKEQQELRR
jgi:ABC-type nitrate/sulfonate/bicarbonate transport system ATPase subunit